MTQAQDPLFLGMFLRKKKNRSGTTSIVVVDKSHGKFRQLKTIGVSSDGEELERLLAKGREWILEHSGKVDIFKDHHREQEEKLVTDQLLSNIENILLNGSELLINRAYDLVGFSELGDDTLRHLITLRLSQPMEKIFPLSPSKWSTVRALWSPRQTIKSNSPSKGQEKSWQRTMGTPLI